MATNAARKGPDESDTVTLTESDGWIVARHDPSGIASQGRTVSEALENLAEALELDSKEIEGIDESDIETPDTPWW